MAAKKTGKRGITAKQRAARKKNMAIARAARSKGSKGSGKGQIVGASMSGSTARKGLMSMGMSKGTASGMVKFARGGRKGGRINTETMNVALSYQGFKKMKFIS